MRRLVLTCLAGTALALTAALPANASTAGDTTVAHFDNTRVAGTTTYRANGDNTVTVTGSYSRLEPGRYYYTDVYDNNTNCDLHFGFFAGPFRADSNGNGSFSVVKQRPQLTEIGKATTADVRRADANADGTPTDLDGDGFSGINDIVGGVGPTARVLGLLQCDHAPVNTDVP